MAFDPISYLNAPRWQHVELGLDRIAELLDGLGRPQEGLRFVHVAGTNGKGSVCSYLASVLQAAGLRTGLFTSPYIERFEERIQVDGALIAPDELADITLQVRDVAEAMADHPTEFELMTAVALCHFARQACDIVVLEVGLGGRFDATNVIAAPEVCVICRLGLDHTAILGDTIEAIAGEKAGIIKPGSPVVSWPQEPGALRVIEEACAAAGSSLTVAALSELEVAPLLLDTACDTLPVRRFSYRGEDFETSLLASYQPANAALAIEAVQALRARGWGVPPAALHDGIAGARWPGRFEVCRTHPLFVVDGGHNPQGAQVLSDTLAELLPGGQTVMLVGILADKDYVSMIETVLPHAGAFVCITPQSPRALPAGELAHTVARLAAARGMRIDVQLASDAADGVRRALALAGEQGTVCAFGSLYSIGALKDALRAG